MVEEEGSGKESLKEGEEVVARRRGKKKKKGETRDERKELVAGKER